MCEKADNYWCTRTLRNKLVYVCVYDVTRLLAAAYTKHNIANSLVKKLLAIQSNKKQYCLKVTSQGSLIIYCNYLIVSFLWFYGAKLGKFWETSKLFYKIVYGIMIFMVLTNVK